MRTTALAAVAAIALAASAARASATVQYPCKLLAAAVKAEPAWGIRLSQQNSVASGGGSWRCELSSKPPAGSITPEFLLVLYFFVSRNAGAAHQNVALTARKGPALAGTGANEAWAVEKHQGGATNTRVTWRRGRYWGWLSIGGLRLSGDTEDARELLRDFLRRLPAT